MQNRPQRSSPTQPRQSATTRSTVSKFPQRAPSSTARTSKSEPSGGLPGWLKIAGAAAVATAAISFGMGGDAYAGSNDEDAPNFDKHPTAVAASPVVLAPDRRLTREIREQILTGADLQIPGAPEIPPELVPSLAKDDVTWYRMTFFDTCAEDGDFVSVSLSNGMFYPTFSILHAGHEIAIPIRAGEAPVATLRAEIDGGGGVTTGAITDDGTWYSAVLPVGAAQAIPVRTR